ncbi:MAG: isoprenylcysteine carboxylmethyltransferase family protein [Gemmatimonadota bacterium]|nr:isoprenylcysteine carboxylmethyltransferase family protein [Gemmatimonadota bacterium]
MDVSPGALLRDLWLIIVAVWLVGALFTKRTVRREPIGFTLVQRILAVSAYVLLLWSRIPIPWLHWRFVRQGPGWGYAGVAVTALGIGLAIWARLLLGGNWSANVTVKESHELIQTGPYRFVRHPIYSGVSLAVAGTALAMGEVRGVLALAFALAAWRVKWPVEEQFMIEQFGDRYLEYRQRVRAIIPGVW